MAERGPSLKIAGRCAQLRRTPKANNHFAGPALGWPMDWDKLVLMLWLIWTATVMAALIAVLFFV